MNMSESFFKLDDAGWKKFVLTGSVYDYLEYKSKIDESKSDCKKNSLDGCGDFCENRGQWNSNQRG